MRDVPEKINFAGCEGLRMDKAIKRQSGGKEIVQERGWIEDGNAVPFGEIKKRSFWDVV